MNARHVPESNRANALPKSDEECRSWASCGNIGAAEAEIIPLAVPSINIGAERLISE